MRRREGSILESRGQSYSFPFMTGRREDARNFFLFLEYLHLAKESLFFQILLFFSLVVMIVETSGPVRYGLWPLFVRLKMQSRLFCAGACHRSAAGANNPSFLLPNLLINKLLTICLLSMENSRDQSASSLLSPLELTLSRLTNSRKSKFQPHYQG